MATDPNAPPDSIVITAFTGLKNTVASERLKPGELERAINVDIDDAGEARRRRGQTRVSTGRHHSLWKSIGGKVLVVRDGVLGKLDAGYTFTALANVGPNQLGYTEVGDTIFYSSRSAAGKILSDDTRTEWGSRENGNGRWLSPVIRPTDTLGPVAGKLLGPPPSASILEAFNGRIYLADDNVIWATELYQFDYVDKTRNYLQFENEITVLVAVDDGLYVGTKDGLYFLNGTFGKGMNRRQVSSAPVIRGSAVRVPAHLTDAGKQRGGLMADAVMLLSEQGVLTCMMSGQVLNATDGTVVFPSADDAAALHREDSGVSSYVTVTRSSGGPATNARIGDFVDAEIRRATGS